MSQTAAEAYVRHRRQAAAHFRVQTAAQGQEVGRLRRRRSWWSTPPAVAGRDGRQGRDGGIKPRLRGTVPRRGIGERDGERRLGGF